MVSERPTARFVVRGSRPVHIEVDGLLDAAASVGFRAVADFFVGDAEVTIDLRRCQVDGELAHRAIRRAVRRIEDAGGVVELLDHTPCPVSVG